jgi:hypothetical protein
MNRQFREDNTEGYSKAQLDELNRRYDLAIADEPETDDEVAEKSLRDYVAEKILAQFDAENA